MAILKDLGKLIGKLTVQNIALRADRDTVQSDLHAASNIITALRLQGNQPAPHRPDLAALLEQERQNHQATRDALTELVGRIEQMAPEKQFRVFSNADGLIDILSVESAFGFTTIRVK